MSPAPKRYDVRIFKRAGRGRKKEKSGREEGDLRSRVCDGLQTVFEIVLEL